MRLNLVKHLEAGVQFSAPTQVDTHHYWLVILTILVACLWYRRWLNKQLVANVVVASLTSRYGEPMTFQIDMACYSLHLPSPDFQK